MDYVVLIVGFVLLTFSADWLVNGASGLAKRLKISDLVIGMTVVAFGTSTPELVVNLVAALNGTSEIAITNIVGSNTINTMIILGLAAVIYPLTAQKSTIRVEMPLSILAGVMVLVLGMDYVPIGKAGHTAIGISRWDGVLLLLIFAVFMIHSIQLSRKQFAPILEVESEANAIVPVKLMPIWKAVLLVIVGLAGLVIGGELIVDRAVKIAYSWGVSEAIVGVTVVALGTSLPELATSVIAAIKKNADIAVGNVIGSNIFNVFFVLSTSSVIKPLASYPNLPMDAGIAALSSLMVFFFVLGKKHTIHRWQGALLLLVYAGYLYWTLA